MSGGVEHCPRCDGSGGRTAGAARPANATAGPPCRCDTPVVVVREPDAGPDPADIALFSPDGPGRRQDELLAIGPEPPARPGRARWAAAGVAAMAVAGCALLAGALVVRDGDDSAALPDGGAVTQLSVPTAAPESSEPSPGASASPSAEASSSVTSSPSASPSVEAPVAPGPEDPQASVAESAPEPGGAEPEAPAPAAPEVREPDEPDDRAEEPQPPAVETLRRGDIGPAVADLQRRLRQVNLYDRRADGRYDRGVEYAVLRYQSGYGVQGDEPGVYGPNTRSSLESRTR
ncbi:peptidoglycan-binding domain-containing protein [Streptomyces sp. 549]|uniref:peptidoglycan-binding domain-containing protein n=1 Tax=Streptomyces sp. 549 TaxID=3049076 RepID=UPI0024C4664F|nr:peptidoglycan-binding domain-containing protein [Streptomyces sp. 549]MDK1473997.1 peptidoglycan-binding domain-containing protein [Streptomyces sp. 549]